MMRDGRIATASGAPLPEGRLFLPGGGIFSVREGSPEATREPSIEKRSERSFGVRRQGGDLLPSTPILIP